MRKAYNPAHSNHLHQVKKLQSHGRDRLVSSRHHTVAFTVQFPDIPVSGMYASYQIGPQATDGDEEQDEKDANNVMAQQKSIQDDQCKKAILRNGQAGSYDWQKSTAMLILFVKPKRSISSSVLLKTLGTEGLAAAVRRVLDRRPVVGRASGGTIGGGGGGDGAVARGLAEDFSKVSLQER